ncbi:DUF3558 domain-containing protein [Actinokineospora xionganensis]|uniref:DUF3558 domain-containing protein n=1 Tax=Actinokineospora xionganensis TaxID=2684470 RepID=A0ABR7L297_9PSEU|nr:DUF3558 domain-containing protein [Actinokineospora xionganensis]MBC6446790.1 DUF3558 domain-containing protein [Actinokineospora xionganensis]
MNTSTRFALAIAAFALAGCTTAPGTPVPASEPSTPTSASKPSKDKDNGAPEVADPIDAKKFIEAPCTLLTSAQTTKLGLESKGSQAGGTSAPYCSWNNNAGEKYAVGFQPDNKGGLSDNYRAEKDGKWEYFEPTTVSGYPAAFLDAVEGRDRGYCGLVVGVRDELTFNISSRGGPGRQACDKIKEIAGEVIATMKAGA